MRNPFKQRKRNETLENPFVDKRSLAQFLGRTCAALISGEINHESAHEIERLTSDFFKMLSFKDFSFELLEGVTEPERKLPYAT
jgi:hypothetical protein